VRRVVSELLPKVRGGASEHDVTAQVEAAVAKVHRGQQAEQVMADIQARLKAVEEKPATEKKPKEYRKLTTWLWGGDDD
jgi:ABC-type hemin transport system substrate-binding protein